MSTSSPKWTFSTTERLLKRKITKNKINENKKKQRTKTPGPSEIRSFFGKEGPSFSFSKVIYNHSDPLDEYAKKHYNVPDPGHYQTNLVYRPDTPSYTISNSLRPGDKKVKEKDTLLGPGHYKINYSSSSKNKKLPDWTFGKTTREDYDDNKQYDKNNKPKPQNPGPGFYSYKNDLFPQGPRYTIAVLPKEAKIEVKPGPGQYNPNFNDKQNEPVYTIGRGVRPDIIKDNKKQNFPGPGFYKIQDVYLAKNVTFPKAGLINSENISKNKKKYKKFEVPGPGFYKIPTAYDYINDYTEICPSSRIYLVGNKLDLERKISRETAKSFANQHKIKYFEVSAKTNENISTLFQQIALDSLKPPEPIPESNNVSQTDNKETKSRCNIS